MAKSSQAPQSKEVTTKGICANTFAAVRVICAKCGKDAQTLNHWRDRQRNLNVFDASCCGKTHQVRVEDGELLAHEITGAPIVRVIGEGKRGGDSAEEVIKAAQRTVQRIPAATPEPTAPTHVRRKFDL